MTRTAVAYLSPSYIGKGLKHARTNVRLARLARFQPPLTPVRLASRFGPVVQYNPYVKAGYITAGALATGAGVLAHMRRRKSATVIARAWRNRRKGAKKEAFRSYARPARARLPSKRTDEYVNETLKSTDTLFTENITLPNEGTAPHQRERNCIVLSGLKFCLEIQNNLATEELYFNIALVQDRSDPSRKTAVPVTKFFRNVTGSDRGADFPYALAIQNHCHPINTDKYRVFMHARMRLAANSDNGTLNYKWQQKHSNTKTFMKYVRFKKQLRFDASNFTNGQLQIVYWAGKVGDTTTTPIVSAFNMRGDVSIYFKDK